VTPRHLLKRVVPSLVLLAGLLLGAGCGYGEPGAATDTSDSAVSASLNASPADSVESFETASEGVPSETLDTSAEPDQDAVIARAIGQVEAALGVPAGSVTVSESAVPLPDAEVHLSCDGGGEAWLDLDTGRVVFLTSGPHPSDSGVRFPSEELDEKATRLAEVMGWGAATLAAEGFTFEEAEIIDHGDAPTEYTKRWRGHDEQGVPTNGMIDAAVDASTGEVLHFFYNPGPRAPLDDSATIAEEEAVAIARAYVEEEGWPPTTYTGSPPATDASVLTTQSASGYHRWARHAGMDSEAGWKDGERRGNGRCVPGRHNGRGTDVDDGWLSSQGWARRGQGNRRAVVGAAGEI
jgi:hypothetical protein